MLGLWRGPRHIAASGLLTVSLLIDWFVILSCALLFLLLESIIWNQDI